MDHFRQIVYIDTKNDIDVRVKIPTKLNHCILAGQKAFNSGYQDRISTLGGNC
jgi:hypothetical protein